MKYIIAFLVAFQLIAFPAVTSVKGCTMMTQPMLGEGGITPCQYVMAGDKTAQKSSDVMQKIVKLTCECTKANVIISNADVPLKKQASIEKISYHITLASLLPEVIRQIKTTRGLLAFEYVPPHSFKAIHARTTRLLI